MSTELNDLLDEARELENADSTAYTDAPATHPNRGKAKILTVRLTGEEMTLLREAASVRGLPVSALVRAAITHELATDDDSTRALISALTDHNLRIVKAK